LISVISDTSPVQYLHQLGLLRLLPGLFGKIIVPQAVPANPVILSIL
jgi:predicted nucleic acid-binding protein